ncbi:MAG: transaldolase family protein [Planctomycetaceae bacterium]
MSKGLSALVAAGTKLWLDSIDPDLVVENRQLGATGATSNPIIIADLIKTGRFDTDIAALIQDGLADDGVAWCLTDQLVRQAQSVFAPVWKETQGNDGYVSFELDPLLEASDCPLSNAERTARYVELGQQWSQGHDNRMIKIPATPAGLAAIEDLTAAGVTLNVTLIFSDRQYQAARDAVWRGAQRRSDVRTLKSVYSIFVSRIDVYTEKHVSQLSSAAQGQVGILNAQRIWRENADWWQDKGLPRQQEIIFASTGTKRPEDPPDKYVAALAGADIQTNPPATNEIVERMGKSYTRRVDQFPSDTVQQEIDRDVDFEQMERVLMEEGLKKFADPQRGLIQLISSKRMELAAEA